MCIKIFKISSLIFFFKKKINYFTCYQFGSIQFKSHQFNNVGPKLNISQPNKNLKYSRIEHIVKCPSVSPNSILKFKCKIYFVNIKIIMPHSHAKGHILYLMFTIYGLFSSRITCGIIRRNTML